MATIIEHERGDVLYTEGDNEYVVEEVQVTTDGKTVSYLLQEYDESGLPIGEPDWYDSKQIELVRRGVWKITKEEGEIA